MTKPQNPFRYFDSSPEVIRLVVMMYVRYPLSLRNVEDLLAERGIDICHETVRLDVVFRQPLHAAELSERAAPSPAGVPVTKLHKTIQNDGRVAVSLSSALRKLLPFVADRVKCNLLLAGGF